MSEPNRSGRGTQPADRRIARQSGAPRLCGRRCRAADRRCRGPFRGDPANVSPPTISGTAVVGETLTVTEARGPGRPRDHVHVPVGALRRQRRAPRASLRRYHRRDGQELRRRAARGDVGSTLRVVETATNAEGTATAPIGTDRGRHPAVTVPVNTAEPVVSGSPVEGGTLMHHDRDVDRHRRSLRVPVGAMRRRRRAPRRLRLPVDPRGHELESTRSRRRHRASAPRPGDRVEREGSATATSNPTDVVSAVDDDRAAAQHGRAVDQWHLRRGDERSSGASARGRVRPLTFTYQWVRCGADGGLADGSNCTSDLRRDDVELHPSRSTTSGDGSASASRPRTASAPRPLPRMRLPRSRRPRPPRRPSRHRGTTCCRRSSARRPSARR